MVGIGRRKSIAFIALGVGLILFTLLLYFGWLVLDWRAGIRLFLGIILLAAIIAGVVLNTVFLVREIRRGEQHDAFINAVTHELKTPIASIRLYVETLKSRSVDEEKRQEFYRIILANTDRLNTTVEQVLRTGRIGASRRSAHMTPLNLSDVVAETVERARVLHHVPAEAIECHAARPLNVMGDVDELRAAVSNLIDNALKYSGQGARVLVSTSIDEDRYATVRVADNGPGIPGAELKRIFKRFYRMHGPVATRVKGMGLGLYIVRSVARRHGGRAWAESAGTGRGSTFTMQLPLTK
ncbi:MAG TPA: HAMP domain-containing sensor histidine kinase [Bryobacteraceae bacterium]|nr:HAMP domain-containing sensor histidine kinase [Bryobacteraceae bacterium]